MSAHPWHNPITESTSHCLTNMPGQPCDQPASPRRYNRLLPDASLAGAPLTTRESEVFALITDAGYQLPARAVGEALGISKRTVEHHLLNLRQKLCVESSAELATLGLRNEVAALRRENAELRARLGLPAKTRNQGDG